MKWSKLNDLIATASADNSIRIFKESETSDPNEPTLSLVHHVEQAHEQDVNCVDWNPTQADLLASCGDDGIVKLWQYFE